ncbi:hypothetical protein CJ030_MR8G002127 [Morella rubra]|uniref:Uncharacterized protein n=1 Tax=Morella rubra TaxID=262757 RepID=A0A6A1UVW1_9ROSI|nr:hypothetical protein CJ030_MR8G002127 [Morella rubra]
MEEEHQKLLEVLKLYARGQRQIEGVLGEAAAMGGDSLRCMWVMVVLRVGVYTFVFIFILFTQYCFCEALHQRFQKTALIYTSTRRVYTHGIVKCSDVMARCPYLRSWKEVLSMMAKKVKSLQKAIN